jgi:uncharacterized protein YggE
VTLFIEPCLPTISRTVAEAAMNIARSALASRFLGTAAVCLWSVPAQPQQLQCPPFAGVVVIGEGNVSVAPDYAQIGAGVTLRASTVREATDSNSKVMAAITAALIPAKVLALADEVVE